MMKKNESIVSVCAYCTHARIEKAGLDDRTPPLLFSLHADLSDHQKAKLTCPYKKKAAPDYTCRRFRFDPLKYKPKKAPPIPTLDEDALLWD